MKHSEVYDEIMRTLHMLNPDAKVSFSETGTDIVFNLRCGDLRCEHWVPMHEFDHLKPGAVGGFARTVIDKFHTAIRKAEQ